MIDTLAHEELKLRILKAEAETAEHKTLTALFESARGALNLRPCHLYPTRTYHNGVTWACEYQGNADAIGCGDCPADAMTAFDRMWAGNKDAGVDG